MLLARGLVAVTAAGLLLTGCSSGDGPAAAGSSTPTGTSATPGPGTAASSPTTRPSSAVVVSGRPGARVYDLSGTKGAGFVSPTGNIACALWTRASGLYDALHVRCDLREHTYTPPPRPADCGTDYGQTIQLDRVARFVCAGDTLRDYVGTKDPRFAEYTSWFDPTQNPAVDHQAGLAYGNSIRVGPVTCTSTRAGVECRNTVTGAGFRIAAGSYRLTP